jgi:hypothetical protein
LQGLEAAEDAGTTLDRVDGAALVRILAVAQHDLAA